MAMNHLMYDYDSTDADDVIAKYWLITLMMKLDVGYTFVDVKQYRSGDLRLFIGYKKINNRPKPGQI